MDTVWLISMQRQWTSDALKEECRKWFSLLLKAVEIKKGVESILGTFLSSSRAVTVAPDCRPHIEAEVAMYAYPSCSAIQLAFSFWFDMYITHVLW